MVKIFATILTITLLLSCHKTTKESYQKTSKVEHQKRYQFISNEHKRDLYNTKMTEKHFSIISNGPCDDALEDTLYQRGIANIESQEINDSSVVIAFKFKDICCQDFLGDYTIANDTLKFNFEQVNDEMCECICWYRYKLVIIKAIDVFKVVNIQKKSMM